MLSYLLRRLKSSALAGRIVLATTDLAGDDRLESLAREEGVSAFRGDNLDLVQRFVEAEREFPSEFVVRVTADCPFVDGASLDHCLEQCESAGAFDLSSTKGRFPVGIDFEIYNSATMREIRDSGALDPEEREHLTLHMYRHPEKFVMHVLQPPHPWTATSRTFTVDTEEDYRFAADLAGRAGRWDAPVSRILEVVSR